MRPGTIPIPKQHDDGYQIDKRRNCLHDVQRRPKQLRNAIIAARNDAERKP